MSGQPLGYAYIQFDTVEAAKKSKELDESLFKGRQLTVLEKRKNIPRMGQNSRLSRGRGRGGISNTPFTMFDPYAAIRGRGGIARGRGSKPGFGAAGTPSASMMMLSAVSNMMVA